MKQTKYPIYIPSKGRADSRQTSRCLEEIGLNYHIVIEESEYDAYSAVIDPKKILVLPKDFRTNPKYAIPDELGQCGGSIPARNFIWEHSMNAGHKRHWIMDDNIRNFYRTHKNTRLRVYSSAPLRVCEDFTDRFTNVRMSGLNYVFFVPVNVNKVPYTLNTRIYSCILLDNSVDHRWRGKYNEDTDLSLRILKDGDCTVLLNSFTIDKATTHSMKGGNTEEVYKVGSAEFDNRRIFAETLHKMHPDCVVVTKKFGRIHHHVNYDRFSMNAPIARPGLTIERGINEYGLRLVRVDENLVPQRLIQFDSSEAIIESNFEE